MSEVSEQEPLELGPIKELVIELDQMYSWDAHATHAAVMEDMCDLIREVERLRGTGLNEYWWSCSFGVYCGGFDYKVVAESLEQAREFAKARLNEYEYRKVLGVHPYISPVGAPKAGDEEYFMDAGG